jgi:hypothetical protein
MNLYQLENAETDNAFLAGKKVCCKVYLHKNEIEREALKAGDPIVIALSSGKKYKGKIIRVDYALMQPHAIGEMIVEKA